MLSTILIILLVLVIIGAFPSWPHAQSWGPYPFGGAVLVLLVVLLLVYVVPLR